MGDNVKTSSYIWKTIAWRIVLNWILVIVFGILLHNVQSAPSSNHIALAVLATVLGLLAAGIFTAYSGLSIEDAPGKSEGFYNLIDTIVFCCLYLLLYLSVFCLYRIGIKTAIGGSIEVILHISLGLLLSAMHLVDVWDRVQNSEQK